MVYPAVCVRVLGRVQNKGFKTPLSVQGSTTQYQGVAHSAR